jgi:hypothetical protein
MGDTSGMVWLMPPPPVQISWNHLHSAVFSLTAQASKWMHDGRYELLNE